MKLAIVIPHYSVNANSDWLLKNCLRSIEKFHPELMRSIIICDDASPMPFTSPHTILHKRKNTSYSANVNMGLEFAKRHADLALILNNDITLTESIEPLLKIMREMKHVTIAGPRLYFPDGRIQHNGIEVLSGHVINHPSYRTWDQNPQGSRFVHVVTGAFMLLRLDRIHGLYPEEYPLSYEDVSFCLREWEFGGSVFFCGKMSAIHNESSTRGYQLGLKELASLNQFHHEQFDFPEVQLRVKQAQEDYLHG